MKLTIYTLHDKLAGYDHPVLMQNDAIAMRAFKTQMQHHPNANDMSLWKIGTFDDETGKIEPHEPRMVAMEE